jgi:hypothetical protein
MDRRPLTEQQIIDRGYIKPRMPHIGAVEQQLYHAEQMLADAIEVVIKETGKVLGHSPMMKWTATVPEVLASILQSYDDKASILAAIAYLEAQGFKVVSPREDAPDNAA